MVDFKASNSPSLNPQKRKFRKEEDVFIKGKVKWVKHLQPDFQFDPAGKWSMVIYPTPGEELEKVRALQGRSGIKNTIRMDEEDGWYMTLSRKCSYTINGRNVGREPPKVFQVVDGQKVDIAERVGNGSDGIARCVLWSSPNFPGSNLRWEELRVDNYIPFKVETDYPDGNEVKLADTDKHKPEEFWS